MLNLITEFRSSVRNACYFSSMTYCYSLTSKCRTFTYVNTSSWR